MRAFSIDGRIARRIVSELRCILIPTVYECSGMGISATPQLKIPVGHIGKGVVLKTFIENCLGDLTARGVDGSGAAHCCLQTPVIVVSVCSVARYAPAAARKLTGRVVLVASTPDIERVLCQPHLRIEA